MISTYPSSEMKMLLHILLITYITFCAPTNQTCDIFLFFSNYRKSNQVGLPTKTFNKPRYTLTLLTRTRRRKLQRSERRWIRRESHKSRETLNWTNMWRPNVTFLVSARTHIPVRWKSMRAWEQERAREIRRSVHLQISTLIYHVDGNFFNSMLVFSVSRWLRQTQVATMFFSRLYVVGRWA